MSMVSYLCKVFRAKLGSLWSLSNNVGCLKQLYIGNQGRRIQ